MFSSFKSLDRILRGEATQLPLLRQGRFDVPALQLLGLIIFLGMIYGLCMGSFAVTLGRAGGWKQMLASMVKVPLLFLLTLLVTFPSLYTFNALVGSRLRFMLMLRLLVAAMSVMLALLASFGTIVAFFSFTTSSYPFIVLFNVVVFSLSGFLGLTFLLRTLHRLTVAQWEPETVEATTNEPVSAAEALFDIVDTDEVDMSADSATPPPLPSARAVKPAGALDAMEQQRLTRDVKTVFQFWIIIFGLVGAQMSWVLRPFIGGGKEFALFRERGGNFFESVASSFSKLFGL